MTITLTNPKNKWARERIQQHGNRAEVLRTGAFRGVPAVNVKTPDGWIGWFTVEDADGEIKP